MWVCGQCGQENPEGARFCNSCGAPLDTAAHPGVRKIVTVLFCDLVGSTSLGDRADAEVFRELMSNYHSEVRTVLERHGGSVAKFVGDAAMAVFGIPHVHEDDALRAVRAAAEVQSCGWPARARGPHRREHRRGHRPGRGDGRHRRRRQRRCPVGAGRFPGEILLGEETYYLVRDAVRVRPAGELSLKGKAERVPAFRLLELLPDVPAFTRPIEGPFIGRRAKLGTLERTLARAIDERTAQLATIVGPPGIGKSRLARELIQRSQVRTLVGRCLSYGEGITYWPLTEVLSQVGDVRSALGDDPDANLVASRIAVGPGTADTAASPEEISWGFRKLFEALARATPLIVAFDDIHSAEPALLDLIEYVSTFARDAPLLLLCMARSDLFERRPGWATPKSNAALITLGPLDEMKVEALVAGLREVPEELTARIVETADGNPLFVEQLLAMQAESGSALEVPPTLQALLAARLDRLEREERSVLERAAVEGRVFHRGVGRGVAARGSSSRASEAT